MDNASAPSDRTQAMRRANRVLVRKLAFVAVAMFGFGFLLVPFYQKICEVTGLREIGGADAVGNTQVDLTREVRVDFDANLHNLAWSFHPVSPATSVHPGEVTQVEFDVVNNTDHAVTGQAIPSYAPQYAAQYFKKLECFCFARQTLQPGERRRMPVVFVIDPSAPRELNAITLSYTFFAVEGNGKG